jgi:hypothetical protein
LYQLKIKGLKMAEQIKKIENELHKFEYGYENGLITEQEFNELTATLAFELKILARHI